MALTLGNQQRFMFLVEIHTASSWIGWSSPLGFVAGCVIEGANLPARRVCPGRCDERARSNAWGDPKCRGRTGTSGGQTGDVDTAEAKQRGIPPVAEQPRSEDVGAPRRGSAREGLTAEPLQRQEGCEDEGFIPERFGLSFQVAVVATHLLEPG